MSIIWSTRFILNRNNIIDKIEITVKQAISFRILEWIPGSRFELYHVVELRGRYCLHLDVMEHIHHVF